MHTCGEAIGQEMSRRRRHGHCLGQRSRFLVICCQLARRQRFVKRRPHAAFVCQDRRVTQVIERVHAEGGSQLEQCATKPQQSVQCATAVVEFGRGGVLEQVAQFLRERT